MLGILFTATLHAQFGFYAEGGGNYSALRATRYDGVVNGKSGFGWQAGIGTEYHTQFGYFLYLGIDFANQTFKKDSTSADGHSAVSNYTYKPLFINFPFGIGYQFDLTKDIGLRVYGGITTQVGVGGNVQRSSNYVLDSISHSSYDKHKIQYGRSVQVSNEFKADLNNTIWGINVGAGLNFSKRVEVAIFYQEGLTNILPGGDAAPEVDKLRSVSLNLKFYFPKNYYSSRYNQ